LGALSVDIRSFADIMQNLGKYKERRRNSPELGLRT